MSSDHKPQTSSVWPGLLDFGVIFETAYTEWSRNNCTKFNAPSFSNRLQ